MKLRKRKTPAAGKLNDMFFLAGAPARAKAGKRVTGTQTEPKREGSSPK